MDWDRRNGGGWAWLVRGQVLWLALGILLGSASTPAAAQFSATLDQAATTVSESVTLSLTFEGGSPKSVPAIPAVPGLSIQYVGQSSEFSIVGSQTSSRLTHDYQVIPQKAGEYVIPAFTVQVDGRSFTSQPLRLKVVPAGQATGAEGGAASNVAFARIVVSRTNLFLGEIIPAEIQLFILNGKPLQYPQFAAEGFTLGKPTEPTQSRAQVGNQLYYVFVFRWPITPAKTGNLTLGPAQCPIEVAIPMQRSRRSLMDRFGSLRDIMERRQLNITSDPVGIQVAPLPTSNVPSDFNGAVGQFTMNISASPTNVSVGDPITVRVRIAGRGQLDSLTLPSITWQDFKPYPPSSKVESTDPLGLEGIKTFEQVVTPQKADLRQLPAFTFSYFDPELKQYQQLQHASIPVVVSPASPVNVAAPIGGASDPGRQSAELAHIKSRSGHARTNFRPLLMQAWFVGLQVLPILAWLAALCHRIYQDRLLSDPRLRRRREAERAAREGWKQLHRFAAACQSEAFFATLFRVLQEEVSGCLNMPASAITEAVVEERLRPAGLEEPTLQELHELFQVCDQARFAPAKTPMELNALLPKLEAVSRALKKWDARLETTMPPKPAV